MLSSVNIHAGASREKVIPRGDYQEWISALAGIGILGAGLGLGGDILVHSENLFPIREDSENYMSEAIQDNHDKETKFEGALDF